MLAGNFRPQAVKTPKSFFCCGSLTAPRRNLTINKDTQPIPNKTGNDKQIGGIGSFFSRKDLMFVKVEAMVYCQVPGCLEWWDFLPAKRTVLSVGPATSWQGIVQLVTRCSDINFVSWVKL